MIPRKTISGHGFELGSNFDPVGGMAPLIRLAKTIPD
jgi:hypothetical protein